MRFLGLGLSNKVPHAKTIWLFRESLVRAGAIEAGAIPDAWKDKPARLAQKDRHARWTVKYLPQNVYGLPMAPQHILDKGRQHMPGEEAWLVGEWRSNGERKYYLSNLPADATLKQLAGAIKARWVCEQAHQQMKEELGLDHFEGRSWKGLHRRLQIARWEKRKRRRQTDRLNGPYRQFDAP